jgi:hypothetical protein
MGQAFRAKWTTRRLGAAAAIAVGIGWTGCAGEEPQLGALAQGGAEAGAPIQAGQGGDGSACAAPRTLCGGACVSTDDDRANCGACGRACPDGQVCSGAACVASACADGEAVCGGACVKIATDRANCGGCGIACPGTEVCQAGRCALAACGPMQRPSDDGTSCVPCSRTAVLDDGPVSYWRLDQTSLADPVADTGTAAVKADGVYLGAAPDVTLGTATAAADGDTGMTMSAKTVASGVLVANYANMPTSEVSVELWERTQPTDGSLAFFSYSDPTHDNAFELLKDIGPLDTVGGPYLYVGNLITYLPRRVDDGAWNMIVVTWSSATKATKGYVNGAQVLDTTIDAALVAGGRLYFGQEQDGKSTTSPGLNPVQALVGDLDDVAVFDKVLTPAQIANHYYGHLCK